MEMGEPTITVIVPAYNAEKFLPLCLDAILSSTRQPDEIIVVDDLSTDGTAAIARSKGAMVLETGRRSGPGAARNLAAQRATGDVLFLVDADVVVDRNAVAYVAENFAGSAGIAAVFGSYDDAPSEVNFVSQYKNLHHHYVHQRASSEASTFWAGCGAVLRSVFIEAGGFDVVRYAVPSIEDIELGHRIIRRGYRIVIDKRLQGKHLKKWTLWSLVRTDVLCRALPWCRLIFESQGMPGDLNLKLSDRVSSVLVCLLALMLPLAFYSTAARVMIPVLIAGVIFANRDLYRFFLKRRGALFVVRAVPLHAFYYLYSAVTFGFCWIRHKANPAPKADMP
jgi:glycosyltransferase involved in cell wall biosynthesis